MPSVMQPWTQELPLMQQSVLMSAMRNADMVEKGHPSKEIIRWYRRCVVLSAFDQKILTDPFSPGGGSYTGPISGTLEEAHDAFIKARDGMSLHYYAHSMHAFEILGYHHPNAFHRKGWNSLYVRMAHALHLWPESKKDMDSRLGDTPEGWKEREDPAGGCTS